MPPFEPADVPPALRRWVAPNATLRFPDQGMTSSVAFVEPGAVVLKRCRDPLYLDWLRRERTVLQVLAYTELSAPRVLDFADLGSEVWLVMTRLPGIAAAEALLTGTVRERRELLEVVGRAIRSLHDLPPPPGLGRGEDWVGRQLVAARSNLAWCDGDAKLLAHLHATRPPAVPATMMHGDLNLENLLVSDGAVTGFIDWAGGDVGDPRCDVALALLEDEEIEFDAKMLTAFFRGYGAEVSASVREWYEGLYEFF